MSGHVMGTPVSSNDVESTVSMFTIVEVSNYSSRRLGVRQMALKQSVSRAILLNNVLKSVEGSKSNTAATKLCHDPPVMDGA